MAGRGPQPKPAHLRQRRNRKAGAKNVEAVTVLASGGVPDLRDRLCGCRTREPEPETTRRKRGRPRKARPACETCGGAGVRPWHAETLAWWKSVWLSEVAANYIDVDRHGMFRLAELVDRYWWLSDDPDASIVALKMAAGEIRLQQVPYGHNPADRSRLQWETKLPDSDRAPDGEDAAPPPVLDPRKVLRALA